MPRRRDSRTEDAERERTARESRETRRRLDESDEPRVAELEQRRDDPASEPAAVSFSGVLDGPL